MNENFEQKKNHALNKTDVMQLVLYGYRFWRKYGAIIILCLMPISSIISYKLYGFIIGLILTVPCVIKKVNKNWYLWYPRQACVLFLFLSAIFG